MKKRHIFTLIGVIILLIVGYKFIKPNQSPAVSIYDEFAQCLTNSDAIFYGAFWCPHCNDQKNLFGSAVQYIPYTECSTPDKKGQLQVCKDANITSYPTWHFSDESSESGLVPLEKLSEKTGCQLPV